MPKYKFGDLVYNITEKRSPVAGDEELYIGLEHLDSGSLRVTRWGSKVALKGDKLIMQKGDILFGRRNTYLRRVAIAPHDGLFSAHGMILRAKTERINSEYLPFFIASDYFMDEAIRISVGSLSPTVNWKELKELEFTIPTLEAQEKLTKTLIAANNLKEKYEELLAITDDLVKSQFIELFGDIPAEDYKSLSDVCKIITDGTHQPPKFVDKGIPFLLVSNITSNAITYDTPKYITKETYDVLMKRTPIEIGDILLSTVGSYGHPAIVKDTTPFSFQRHIAYLKPDSSIINSVYLHTAILSEDVQNQIEVMVLGVAQKTLNLSSIRGIKIPVPSLERQLSFNLFVEQTDKSKFVAYQETIFIEKILKYTYNHTFRRKNNVH